MAATKVILVTGLSHEDFAAEVGDFSLTFCTVRVGWMKPDETCDEMRQNVMERNET